jgi:hypothetical protein
MGQTLQAGVAPGLALAGVLVIAGFLAARFGGVMPHLGVGAVGAAVAVGAGRMTSLADVVVVVVIAAGAAAVGAAAWFVDARVRETEGPLWPPALLPEIAVLGVAIAVAAFVRAPLAVDLPVGPLGGFPALPEGIIALGLGVVGVGALSLPALRDRSDMLIWAVGAAVVGVAAILGSGALALRAGSVAPVFGAADVVGIAIRAAAVGVVARYGVTWGVAAGVLLGLAEGLITTAAPSAQAGVIPALIVLGAGLVVANRQPATETVS